MDCVCGCGREVSGSLRQRNMTAASVALELLVWDRNRASPDPGPDGREGLIARGADCYARLLDSIHGAGGDDPDLDCQTWLRESTAMRAGHSGMTRRRFLGNGRPSVSDEDLDLLDRKHPERSFTGHLGTPTTTTADEDLVDKLERLRALRDDEVLTEDEFVAAKARLLDQG